MTNDLLHPLWHPVTSAYPRLSQNVTVDVAVVGGGIVGLTTALLLKRQGRTVALLEAEQIGSGTTGATSAHLTTLHDHGYGVLEKAYDSDTARLVHESMSEAIGRIEGLVMELGIDCDFRRVPGYLFTERDDKVQALNDELAAAKRAGVQAESIADVPLPFETRAGFEVRDQARFHPLRYLAGLSAAVDGNGSRIYEATRVVDVHDGRPSRLTTDQGFIVTARNIVLATHTPIGFSAMQATLQAFRSFILVARVTEQPADALFWDTEEPYNYIRYVEDDAGRPLVLIGGQDSKTGHADEHAAMEALEAWARQRFAVEEIVTRWSAQFYDPADHLPSIGKMPLSTHTYVATGFSGEGLTLGTIGAHIIVEQLMGRETVYDSLYRPARLRLAGLKDLFKGQLDVAKSFVGDRLRSGQPASVVDLAPGEGCVVRSGGQFVAAFCDEDGDIRTMSAVCPHLKCIVHWNGEQSSFDCPCHGSRFDTNGNVLEGPSLKGLEEVETSQEVRQILAARRDDTTWRPESDRG